MPRPDGPTSEPTRRRTLAVVSLGCRVNRADAAAVEAQVAARLDLAARGEPADLVLVNTCCVTADAEAASRQAVRRAAKDHPSARIVASGCYAEVAPEALRDLPGVAAVVGARRHGAVAGLLLRLADEADDGEAGAVPGAAARRDGGTAGDAASPGAWSPPPLVSRLHARPALKVQDGCDARCAYCLVPSARGASRSLPFEEAVSQLVAMGAHHREVVLTGVHLGAYGRDLAPARSLEALVAEAAARGFRARLRLSSIEAEEFPRGLLLRRETATLLCEHVHLPLQSGSRAVLAAMGRHGGPEAFLDAVEAVAALMPGAAIGTDLLVGFPGETAEDHRRTVALCEALPLAYLHVFPYSARPGTPAASLPGAVPPDVVRERARELLDLSSARWRAFLAGQAGRVAEVVVERIEGGLARGTARNHVGVRWPAGPEPRGELVRVRIEASDGAECFGVRAAAFDRRLPP